MNHTATQAGSGLSPAMVVELVGPACAGKTTLTGELTQRSKGIEIAPDISVRRLEHLAVFARTVPLLLPILLPGRDGGRWFTWDEIKSMVYLRAWPRILEEQAAAQHGVILLDQGPVFRLATLHAFGPDMLRRPAARSWWNNMIKRWAATLDLVVWLDAPNPILEQRINARERWHLVKGKPEREAAEFLDRYRKSYYQVLWGLSLHGRPGLMAFNTERECICQVADAILPACKLELSRG